MGETMKAVRLHAFGGPEVLTYEDGPKPDVRPGEVLVRVRAVGLNPPDWYLRDGYRALVEQLGADGSQKNAELTRYVVSLIALERKLAKRKPS